MRGNGGKLRLLELCWCGMHGVNWGILPLPANHPSLDHSFNSPRTAAKEPFVKVNHNGGHFFRPAIIPTPSDLTNKGGAGLPILVLRVATNERNLFLLRYRDTQKEYARPIHLIVEFTASRVQS